MSKLIVIECSDEKSDRLAKQIKDIVAEYEYQPFRGPGKVYEFGPLRIDQPQQEVTIHGNFVSLSRREFQILGLFASHPSEALPCDFLHNDIVNIGLHFFLKDVRPMLPPVMNHSIAVA